MEASADPEKRRLIETEPEHHAPCPTEKYSDSEGFSDASGGGDLCRLDGRCREFDVNSQTESRALRLARRKLLAACAVTLLFMVAEVIGGYAASSLAIMTDAAHLLTDFGSIMISVFSLWLSSRPPTQTMTFGWQRAEILGMLVSVVSIWLVTAVLVVLAAQRIADGDYIIDSQMMLLTSGCAVGVNVLMVLILHQSGASHAHGPQPRGGERAHHHGNDSVKAAFVHAVGDLLQSVAVLLAAAVVYIWPECKAADPLCTFLFSALVLWTTLPVSKEVFRILMDAAPRHVKLSSVRDQLLSLTGVSSLHSLHMWSLNTSTLLLSVHLIAEEAADAQVVLAKASERLRSEFGFAGVTIQVEKPGPSQDEP